MPAELSRAVRGVVDPGVAALAHRVVDALSGRCYPVRCEKDLQDRIGVVLDESGLAVAREHRLSERDRPDFFVEGAVVVEVKLKTPRSQVLRQLGRYAEHEQVQAVVLASPSFVTLRNMRLTIHGVPVYPVALRGPGLIV